MERTKEQNQLLERFVLVLIDAVRPLQQGVTDPELTLELLIEAADQLKEHLQKDLQELREESD